MRTLIAAPDSAASDIQITETLIVALMLVAALGSVVRRRTELIGSAPEAAAT